MKTEKECIEYIHSLSKFGSKSGLDNIIKICSALGDPQDGLNFIHVAGTNGKGSVCACIASIMSKKYKTGLYISPYIEVFNERISINGENISSADLVRYTNEVKTVCEAESIYPIEFEFITAVAFLYFSAKKCDVVVLETGLGGRLDSTNVIKNPLACVITAIGYDHTAILGDTVEKIAFEKSGIIKSGSPVIIYGDMDAAARKVIAEVCAQKGSKFYICPDIFKVALTIDGTDFTYCGRRLHTALCGSHQAYNAALAVAAIYAVQPKLPVDTEDISDGLRTVKWKCRFEVVECGDKKIILDGAHNAHGISAFCAAAESLLGSAQKVLVFGMLGEKDCAESIEKLCRLKNISIIVTAVPSVRATNCQMLISEAKKHCDAVEYIENCIDAVQRGFEKLSDGGALCVIGSLYLVGAVRKICSQFVCSKH